MLRKFGMVAALASLLAATGCCHPWFNKRRCDRCPPPCNGLAPGGVPPPGAVIAPPPVGAGFSSGPTPDVVVTPPPVVTPRPSFYFNGR